MATSLPSLTPHTTGIPTDITCPICMEKYSLDAAQNPVMLPNCGHTICRGCLTGIHTASQTEHFCPICRAPSNGPNPENLPANFIVLSIMQAHLDSSENISSNHHKEISQASADRMSEMKSYHVESVRRSATSKSTPRTTTSISMPLASFPRPASRPSTSNESSPNKSQGVRRFHYITQPASSTPFQQSHRPVSAQHNNDNALSNHTLDSYLGCCFVVMIILIATLCIGTFLFNVIDVHATALFIACFVCIWIMSVCNVKSGKKRVTNTKCFAFIRIIGILSYIVLFCWGIGLIISAISTYKQQIKDLEQMGVSLEKMEGQLDLKQMGVSLEKMEVQLDLKQMGVSLEKREGQLDLKQMGVSLEKREGQLEHDLGTFIDVQEPYYLKYKHLLYMNIDHV